MTDKTFKGNRNILNIQR